MFINGECVDIPNCFPEMEWDPIIFEWNYKKEWNDREIFDEILYKCAYVIP